jgi:DNA/RNA endonuclease G (NUC1)
VSRNRLLTLLFVLALVIVVVLVLVVLLGEGEGEAPPPQPTQSTSVPPAEAPQRNTLHLTLGNPSGATTSASQPHNYLISRPQYALAYDRYLGTPIWASWHLGESDLGAVERYAGQFMPDTDLPSGWRRVQHDDYTGSGYDRGHMVPSADRTSSRANNEATFILSNIIPQAPANNQGPWAALEGHLRELVWAGNEVYIIAGPQGVLEVIADGALTVPEAVWKVAVVLPEGRDDLERISRATTVIAVLMPNDDTVESRSWEEYTTSVACVEARTGLDLLAALPDPLERQLAGAGCSEEGQGELGAAAAAGVSGVSITTIEANPPGEDLAGEHVLLSNTGPRAVSLTGWTLEDGSGATYTFPEFSLGAGRRVRIWVQSGEDDDANLYWGRRQPVWNNDSDTAILRNPNGKLISRLEY